MSQNVKIRTRKNLEAAFAGESMAYQKYLYFAKLARKKGNEEVAQIFEKTAKDEIGHAEGHLNFLYPADELSVADLLRIAFEGETYEYTEMYPSYAKTAHEEGQASEVREFNEQIAESKEHAQRFERFLPKLEKIFSGLSKVEKKHAEGYEKALSDLSSR